MKKYTNQGLGVAVALAVVAVLLYGNQLMSLFQAGSTEDNANVAANLSTGVKVEDLVAGTGQVAAAGDSVTVHYVGMLTDGQVFDSSRDRGQPFTFTLGAGEVIRGWDQGVVGMRVGGKRRLTIAPDYAYGNNVVGPIPANSTLVFEVELLGVQKPAH